MKKIALALALSMPLFVAHAGGPLKGSVGYHWDESIEKSGVRFELEHSLNVVPALSPVVSLTWIDQWYTRFGAGAEYRVEANGVGVDLRALVTYQDTDVEGVRDSWGFAPGVKLSYEVFDGAEIYTAYEYHVSDLPEDAADGHALTAGVSVSF